MTIADHLLKEYMLEHFNFRSLKRIGFYKDVKASDYTEQAKRVCEFFGLESVFEYHKIGWGQPVHFSWANDPNGFRPFIEVVGKMKSTTEAKVIPISKIIKP